MQEMTPSNVDLKPLKVVIVIPTYNEHDNIGKLLSEIISLKIPGHELHMLVVDDCSPDGTGAIVTEIAKTEPRVRLLSRTKKRGRGFAGIDGFLKALADQADYIIEMDADFSHHPRYLPKIIEEADKGADVVVGSRFVKGGADVDRGALRRVITFLAGIYVRFFLDLKMKDVSSGYRCFRRRALEAIDLDDMVSTGPSIVQELLYKTVIKGFTVKEVPIEFKDRRQGETKLNWIILLEVLLMVLRLKDMKKRGRLFNN